MADTKISALADLADPSADDLLVFVDDPGGTPITKKATLANVLTTGSTDNAILRADGTGGAAIQNSWITVDDTNTITFPSEGTPVTYFIRSANQTTADKAGNPIDIIAGDGNGTGVGGDIFLAAGAAGATATRAGNIRFDGGVGSGGNTIGGTISFVGGLATGTGAGGPINFTAGQGGASGGDGADIQIIAGARGGLGTNSGSILLSGGGNATTKGAIKIKNSLASNGWTAFLSTNSLATSDKTFTFPNTTGTFALTANKLSDFAATTSLELKNTISDETGSGALVFATSPGFTTAANPVSNDGAALGTTALGWSDLHLATGAVINFANGEVTLTETDADTLTLAGATSLAMGTSIAVGLGTIELGHASDTTIARVSAGVISVEGVNVLLNGGALGTPSSGTLTNATGLPLTGLVSDTTTALGIGSINLGHASDTTVARVSAGVISVEGSTVAMLPTAQTFTAQQTISLGSAATTEPLRLVNTTDNASVQVAQFEGDRATMAADDEAYVSMLLSDSAGNQDEQARITWKGTTITDGATQDGQLILSTLLNNSLTTALTIGGATINATFAGDVAVPDTAYGAGWNGSLNVPTRNAVYDQMELKAPIASPTFTGTVTLPTGLTGVIRADSGVVSVDTDVTDLVIAASDTASGKIELAIQSEMETATDVVRAVTPGRQHFHPAASKFWVYWTANSTTILKSYNIDSIADTAVGDADGTITTDFSDANWAGFVCTNDATANGWDADSIQSSGFNARAAGTFGVLCGIMVDGGTAAGNLIDPQQWQVVGFGDQ